VVPESSRLCNNTEEGHDKIVKEILRRLEKNDLYIKPEKCIWKVRKIGFLGVVIEPNGIEMETEKVDGVLNWPQPKNMKDIRKFLGLANYYRSVRATGVELQEIPQFIIIYEIWLQPTSRRFLRELDEAPGGNNLYYILQCLHVPALVTRV